MGVPPEQIAEVFCGKDGLYLHQMNDVLSALVRDAWAGKDNPEIGALRYLTVRLLHELMTMQRNYQMAMPQPKRGRSHEQER